MLNTSTFESRGVRHAAVRIRGLVCGGAVGFPALTEAEIVGVWRLR